MSKDERLQKRIRRIQWFPSRYSPTETFMNNKRVELGASRIITGTSHRKSK